MREACCAFAQKAVLGFCFLVAGSRLRPSGLRLDVEDALHTESNMLFGSWDTLYNILLFVFWFRIWTHDDRTVYFNHYLSQLNRLAEGAVNFLKPVFFGLSGRSISLIALSILLALRAASYPHGALTQVDMGGFVAYSPDVSSVLSCLAFSALSLGLFLFKLWGLSLVYSWVPLSRSQPPAVVLRGMAMPFSRIQARLKPLVLVAFGCFLALMLRSLSDNASAWNVSFARLIALSLAEWVDVLLLARTLMILLIIGSWISMFAASPGIAVFCREWLEFFLGPLRRYPLRLGMFDLTPLIFFFALGFVHYALKVVLANIYLI